MQLLDTPISGLIVIAPEFHRDSRGGFARMFCERELAAAGHPFRVRQSNISTNVATGTLRGLHYQAGARPEAKIVRCVRGAIFDVAVDLRRGSATYGKWHGVELSETNHRLFLIPEGFAHGFVTLAPDAELLYLMSEFFEPGAAAGVRWDDPDIAVDWPIAPEVISERDRSLPLLSEIA